MSAKFGRILGQSPDGDVFNFGELLTFHSNDERVSELSRNAPSWHFFIQGRAPSEMIGRTPCVLRGDMQRKVKPRHADYFPAQSEESQTVHSNSRPFAFRA